SRSCDGFWPYAKQSSIGVPTGKPAIRRPPEMQSIIENSSATRVGGLYNARELPMTQIAVSVVRRDSDDAIRLGEGISPYPLEWCSLTQIASNPHVAAYSSSSMKSLYIWMRPPRVEQRRVYVNPHRG